MLRRAALRDGERRQGLRGHREREAARAARKVHEVQGWLHGASRDSSSRGRKSPPSERCSGVPRALPCLLQSVNGACLTQSMRARLPQVSSGQPVKDYVDTAVRHVLLRQGVIGIKVKVMLEWDPTGKVGPKKPLPDTVTVHKPKEARPRCAHPTRTRLPHACSRAQRDACCGGA